MKMSMCLKSITIGAVAAVMMSALYTDVLALEEPVTDPVLEIVESDGTQIVNEDTELLISDENDRMEVEEQTDQTDQVTEQSGYETKLRLTKKKTTLISGEKNITLAVAKYSSKTSVVGLAKARLQAQNASFIESGLPDSDLKIDGNTIVLDSQNTAPGIYTLKVWPILPEKDGNITAYVTPATLTVTVKQPIDHIAIEAASHMYKQVNKAATIKPVLILNNGDGDRKPYSNKVIFELLGSDGEPLSEDDSLYGHLNINNKNGMVTLDKNYVHPDSDNDFFYIKARAADFDQNECYGISGPISIVDKVTALTAIKVGTDDLKGTYGSHELEGKNIKVYSDTDELSPSDLIFRSSDKSFVIDRSGVIKTIGKAGKYKITASAANGTKSSITTEVVIKEGTASSYELKAYAMTGHEMVPVTFADDGTAVIEPASVLLVALDATVNNGSILKNTSSVKVKGGAILNKGTNEIPSEADWISRNYLFVKPKSSEVKITYTYGSGREKKTKENRITFSSPAVELKPKGALKKSLDIYSDSEKTEYTMEFTAEGLDDSKDYFVAFTDTASGGKMAEARELLGKQLNSGYDTFCPNCTVSLGTVTVKCEIGREEVEKIGIPKGTYIFSAVISEIIPGIEGGEPMMKRVSNACDIKINAAPAKAPSVSLTTGTVELKYGGSAKIPFKVKKNVRCINEAPIAYYDNNDKGNVNNFRDNFKVSLNDGELVLEHITTDYRSFDPDSDCRGWVEYSVTGLEGRKYPSNTETVKVRMLPFLEDESDVPQTTAIHWLGDSLTQGSLGEDGDNIAGAPYKRLEKDLQSGGFTEVGVEGLGLYGKKTGYILEKYKNNHTVSPDIVYVFWVGSNDWVDWGADPVVNTDTSGVIKKIDRFLLSEAGFCGKYIVIGTTDRKTLGRDNAITINKALKSHYKNHYVDILAIIDKCGYSSDKTHLSQRSYNAIADMIYEKIREMKYVK